MLHAAIAMLTAGVFADEAAAAPAASMTPVSAQEKAKIDEAARAAGFALSDYPYCTARNGCGPDGWLNWLAPDLTHILLGCDLSGACDLHDVDYMTVGLSRDAADERFKLELHAAVVRYVEATRARLAAEEADRIARHTITSIGGAFGGVVDAVAKHGPEVVVEDRGGWFGWARKSWGYAWGYGWGWTYGVVQSRGDALAAAGDAVSWGWDSAWGGTSGAVQGLMLTQAQIDFMHWEADLYYEAVRVFGAPYYEFSQAEQKRYDQWYREWSAGNAHASSDR